VRKKLLILFAVFLVILMVIGAFRYKYNLERKAIVEIATKQSQEYIKKYYDSDFVITDYDIIHPSVSSTIYLNGYIEGHEDAAVFVAYNYKNKEVYDVGGPKWFLNSEKKNVP